MWQIMWQKEPSHQNDKPPTDYEDDEDTLLADSDVKSRYNPLHESGDDCEKGTLVSGRSSVAPFIAETICDSTAPTFKRSERSARKVWQPPGLKTDASQPTVGFIGVENHAPNTYPDSRHIERLKSEYKRKLQAMLPPSDPDQCTTMVVYRPHDTVGSQSHLRDEWLTESGFRFPSHDCIRLGCRPVRDPQTPLASCTDDPQLSYWDFMRQPHHVEVGTQHDPFKEWVARSNLWHELRSERSLAPRTDDPQLGSYEELMRRPCHAEHGTQYRPGNKGVARPELWSLSNLSRSPGSRDPFHLQAQPAFADSPGFPEHIEYLESRAGLPDDLQVGRDPDW